MLLKIKVKTNCKKEEIIKKKEDTFWIKVKEKPIQNEANKRILEMLATYFKVPNKLRIVKGARSPNKIIEI